jgi:multiple sugar transport system ATP-binding protein
MMEGQPLQVAPPGAIYSDPADLRVARFVGSPRINSLDGSATGRASIEVGGIELPFDGQLAAGARVTVAFRPAVTSASPDPKARGLAGTLTHRENLGSDLFLHVRLDGLEAPVIVRDDPATIDAFPVGGGVRIQIPAEHMLVFDEAGKRLRARAPLRATAAQ